MPEDKTSPTPAPPPLPIITAVELLKLRSEGAEIVRRARWAFNRGGAFDVTTLINPGGARTLVVVVAMEPNKLTKEQIEEIASAHCQEAAKLAEKIKAEPK